MTLGKWLKRNKKSQTWLAGEVDTECTQALVSKWVRGTVLPSPNRLRWIETITGGEVTARGIMLRYKRVKAAIKSRGEAFRQKEGIE